MKTATQIEEMLFDTAATIDLKEKIVLFRVFGTLQSGRSVDIDFRRFKEFLLNQGAIYANVNRNALQTKERITITIKSERKADIEKRIFKERIPGFKIDPAIKHAKIRRLLKQNLTGSGGTNLAHNLLNVLRTEKREGETTADFQNRVLQDILAVTRLEESS